MNLSTTHEVICFHCANAVAITPDATTCSVCGEDLQHLLPSDATIDYFRERALGLSADGEGVAALAEVERGLTFAESSDLHLLAAILAEKLERFDQMRRHVAAIPVDDTLRGEAEWLLRAHQDRQRTQRETARQRAPTVPPSAEMLDDLLGRTNGNVAAQRRTIWSALASVALITAAGAVVVTSWWWFGPGALPANVERAPSVADLPVDPGEGAEANADVAVTPLPILVPTDAPAATTSVADASTPGASWLLPTPTATPQPTAVATAAPTAAAADEVPPDLVLVPTESPELADASARSMVVVSAQLFDVDTFLRDAGRPDLADLNVTAQLQDDYLMLQGVVNWYSQQQELIELLVTVPGVNRVIVSDLLVRPLPTYTVQEGDTLWSIVEKIYGSADRLDEFYRNNLDVLPTQDALEPGMKLKVLPIR